jgi:glucose dehydrogenase
MRRISPSSRLWLVVPLSVLSASCMEGQAGSVTPVRGTDAEWTFIGGDAHHTRSSPLTQINATNFANLQVAWEFNDTTVGATTARGTPIYVDGMLFSTVGERRYVVRLDPTTGAILWKFVEPETARSRYSMRTGYGKGVAYARVNGRGVVYISTPGFFLFALDAETGQPLENWGRPIELPGFPPTGGADMMQDLAADWESWTDLDQPWDPDQGLPLSLGYITNSSPPIVVNDVVIVGNSAEQGYHQTYGEAIPSDILGYDTRTGEHLWTFHMIPRPGEFGAETWEGNRFFGEVSSWAPMAADPVRGIVYIPTNSGTVDYFGGHRPGDNLYGTSLVALDVRTGERKWHFQMVHHDVWNYDTSTAPILMDVTVNGERIPGVFQTGKQVFVYAFNRETGDAIWPIEERPVPQSKVPGEKLSPTQPFPTKPAPYDMQGFSLDDVIDFTPELRAKALEQLKDFEIGPLFLPPLHRDNAEGKKAAFSCPGGGGGTNITGPSAADPTTGVLYVMSQKGCWNDVLVPGTEAIDDPLVARHAGTTLTDFTVVGAPDENPGPVDGLPIFKPPYGRLTAIDMNTGEHLWWVVRGETPNNVKNHPALQGLDIPNTGHGGGGSLMVLPSMVLMSARGSDNTPYLYAIDKQTGATINRIRVPAFSSYGMMTYMHDGAQYILLQVPTGWTALKLPTP